MRSFWLAVALFIATLPMCAPPRASEGAYALSGDEVVSLVCAPQFAWDCETALAITWRESNWQPHAYNAKSGCAGLWQIHPLHGYSLSTRFDPEASTAIAYDLWLREGWGPWRIQ